jgi:hypothetical protein
MADIPHSRIWNKAVELRPADLLVLYKAAAHPAQRWTYAALAASLGVSASQVHRSVQRAVAAGLAVMRDRGDWSPVRPALLEFAVHGVRYVWPAQPGPVKRGVPTAFGVEPLASRMVAAEGEAPVWAHPAGTHKGPALPPLTRSVPQAALADTALHQLLALQDALRTGRARERTLAQRLLADSLSIAGAS